VLAKNHSSISLDEYLTELLYGLGMDQFWFSPAEFSMWVSIVSGLDSKGIDSVIFLYTVRLARALDSIEQMSGVALSTIIERLKMEGWPSPSLALFAAQRFVRWG